MKTKIMLKRALAISLAALVAAPLSAVYAVNPKSDALKRGAPNQASTDEQENREKSSTDYAAAAAPSAKRSRSQDYGSCFDSDSDSVSAPAEEAPGTPTADCTAAAQPSCPGAPVKQANFQSRISVGEDIEPRDLFNVAVRPAEEAPAPSSLKFSRYVPQFFRNNPVNMIYCPKTGMFHNLHRNFPGKALDAQTLIEEEQRVKHLFLEELTFDSELKEKIIRFYEKKEQKAQAFGVYWERDRGNALKYFNFIIAEYDQFLDMLVDRFNTYFYSGSKPYDFEFIINLDANEVVGLIYADLVSFVSSLNHREFGNFIVRFLEDFRELYFFLKTAEGFVCDNRDSLLTPPDSPTNFSAPSANLSSSDSPAN